MIKYITLAVSLLLMIAFMPHFSEVMQQRASLVKLGFVPKGKLYKAVVGSFRWFEGEYYTFKSIVYYGSKTKAVMERRYSEIEYYNLYRTLKAAIILNPYNEDAYYFAQAILAWDVRQVKAAIKLLEYVYKYRPWDFQIPFFLGFDYGYFLHDYKKAAKYYKDAANLTHASLFVNLAARYLYEGGDTEAGIIYLKYIISQTRNKNLKKIYQKRLDALQKIEFLQKAVEKYKRKFGKMPTSLKELVDAGIIDKIPKDPYGGRFYISKNGKIETTSKLAEGWRHGSNRSNKSK